MADRYLDIAYVNAALESSVRISLAENADEIYQFIEMGSAEVAGMLRNSGYDVPASPIVLENVHPSIKAGTMCVVWEAMVLRPRYSLELPEKWDEMPYRRALEGIENGTLQLGIGQATSSAPGGWIFTDTTTRTGGTKLRGY